MWTDDPVLDFERYDREQQRRLRRLPRCSVCGEPIQEETAFYIDGAWICDACMDSKFKRYVEDEE